MASILTVLSRTAEVDGAAAALQLGAAVAASSSNEDLLKQMVAFARASGDAAAIEQWETRQRIAADARTQLARKSS